jgi:hypothetical protein
MPFRATRALVAGLLITACSDEPTQARGDPLGAHAAARRAPPLGAVALASTPGYSQLDAASVRGTSGSLHASVDAGAAIPRFPDEFVRSVAVFGYAWLHLAAGKGVVAVIHPAIGADSHQNPNAWHTHPVQLTAGTASSDFCIVSIGTSQGGISIHDDVLRLEMAERQAGISASLLDVAAAFVVQPDAGCASGLGVEVLAVQTF